MEENNDSVLYQVPPYCIDHERDRMVFHNMTISKPKAGVFRRILDLGPREQLSERIFDHYTLDELVEMDRRGIFFVDGQDKNNHPYLLTVSPNARCVKVNDRETSHDALLERVQYVLQMNPADPWQALDDMARAFFTEHAIEDTV